MSALPPKDRVIGPAEWKWSGPSSAMSALDHYFSLLACHQVRIFEFEGLGPG
jgi:hypothetical protein